MYIYIYTYVYIYIYIYTHIYIYIYVCLSVNTDIDIAIEIFKYQLTLLSLPPLIHFRRSRVYFGTKRALRVERVARPRLARDRNRTGAAQNRAPKNRAAAAVAGGCLVGVCVEAAGRGCVWRALFSRVEAGLGRDWVTCPRLFLHGDRAGVNPETKIDRRVESGRV